MENEILEHATRLFAERGFAGTSLQDVADAMSLTRPALYYYVKSKDELLAKLVEEVVQAPAAALKEIGGRDDLDAADKLRMLVRTVATRIATHANRFRLLVKSEAELPADVAKAHADARHAVLDAVVNVLDQGVTAGRFRPVDTRVAALGILGMCNWVAWWYHPGGSVDIDTVSELLADMAVAGVQRADHRKLRDDSPGAVIAMLREDLDHLERLISDQ
ncbi:TetR/AcrR family transcriptional regulator [Streptomyces malaysiensis]|uniref:TetR/AcrR family transcriptional regulator n=1 Tax=Streptomyces malaysiensis TaxID=92644 RepID=UPI00371AE7A7